jgi:hypothetical protein
MARIHLLHAIAHPGIDDQEGPWPNWYPGINLSRTQLIKWWSTPLHHPGHSRAVAHACPRRRHGRHAVNRWYRPKIGQTMRSKRIREDDGARECVFLPRITMMETLVAVRSWRQSLVTNSRSTGWCFPKASVYTLLPWPDNALDVPLKGGGAARQQFCGDSDFPLCLTGGLYSSWPSIGLVPPME